MVALRDQDVVQVSHAPTLIAVGEANRAAVLGLGQFLRRALRAGKGTSVLEAAPRFGLADAVLLFRGRVIGMGRWNVSLTASHSDRAGCHLFVVCVLLPWQRFRVLCVSRLTVCLQVLNVISSVFRARAVSAGFSSASVVFLLFLVVM